MKQRILNASAPFLIAGIALIACVVPLSQARAGTGLTIQPVKISQTLTPGEGNSGKILLTNASEDDVSVDIDVQDFIPTAGTETYQFVGRAPGVTTVRDWITIETPLHFTFKKGESKDISYTIKAPANAEPGSHFGVLFFKATRVSDLQSSIKVGTQVGVLVFVTIPGNFEQKGTISEFTTQPFVQRGPIPFSFKFENTGTVHFEPKGTIEITNMFGAKVGSVPIEGYAVLPTGVKKMSFQWLTSGFLLGKYKAVASVYDGENNLLSSQSTSFYAFPIWYIIGFIIAVIILFLLISFIKSRIKFSVSLKK